MSRSPALEGLMKYSDSISIELPREQVVALFCSTDNLKHWQPDLLEHTLLEGEPGAVGAKTELRYRMGKRELVMVETIQEVALPDHLRFVYEAKGVWNGHQCHFAENPDGSTQWSVETEFRCSGFMWLFIRLMPGAFKKETRKTLEAFKAFAESTDGTPEPAPGLSTETTPP